MLAIISRAQCGLNVNFEKNIPKNVFDIAETRLALSFSQHRYRLLGYAGHEYILRSSDMKFRSGLRVLENPNYRGLRDDHKFKIMFRNMMGDEKDAHLEVHSNGYTWVEPGKSHEFHSNENHEFILRDSDNKPKVGVTIVDVDGGYEL